MADKLDDDFKKTIISELDKHKWKGPKSPDRRRRIGPLNPLVTVSTPLHVETSRSYTHDYTPTEHSFIKFVLESELQGAVDNNQEPAKLLEDLFPDSVLPFDISKLAAALKRREKDYTAIEPIKPPTRDVNNLSLPLTIDEQDYKNGIRDKWIDLPKLHSPVEHIGGVREMEFSTFINRLGRKILLLRTELALRSTAALRTDPTQIVIRTEFTGLFSTTPLPHTPGKTLKNSTMDRKPDVSGFEAFIDSNGEVKLPKDVAWRLLRLFMELKCGFTLKFHEHVHIDISNESYLMFAEQIDRRFIIAGALHQYELYIAVVSRSGSRYSFGFNIKARPKLFLRFIVGILFAQDRYIGYDPTMKVESDGSGYVIVDDKKLKILKELFRSCVVRGRATTVLLCEMTSKAEDGGIKKEKVAMKDSWVLRTRRKDEAFFYKKAQDAHVRNVPFMLKSWHVTFEDVVDTTETIPGFKKDSEVRIHQRLILREYGESLQYFESKLEFLYALIDALEAHLDLLKAGILHRDVSIFNILLCDRRCVAMRLDAYRRGYLLDLEFCKDENDPNPEPNLGHRTGTKPFMSSGILIGDLGQVVHRAHDDLESFYYIFIYACVTFIAPRTQRPGELPDFMYTWQYDTALTAGQVKRTQLHSDDKEFSSTITDYFTRYMSNLSECANELRREVSKGGALNEDGSYTCHASHEAMIAIINTHIKKLTEGGDTENLQETVEEYKRANPLVEHNAKLRAHKRKADEEPESPIASEEGNPVEEMTTPPPLPALAISEGEDMETLDRARERMALAKEIYNDKKYALKAEARQSKKQRLDSPKP